MKQNLLVPQDVLKTPADPNGNGFIVGDIYTESLVGSDSEIYMRRDGEVFIAPSEDRDEAEEGRKKVFVW